MAETVVAGCLIAWQLFAFLKRRRIRARQRELVRRVHDEISRKVHRTLALEDDVKDGDGDEDEDQDGEDFFCYSAVKTKELISAGKLDPCRYVVRLSKRCRRYGKNGEGVNAITEELYDEAYEMARQQIKDNENDKEDKDNKEEILRGIPISVKDSLNLAGCYATAGLIHKLGCGRRREDCLPVHAAKMAGAIPLCKGNVPQLLMMAETYNNIWGRTRNPWNLDRGVGGSSGGDAALVAMGCLPLALASDVAGSSRIPACCCGVCGFKATTNRLSMKGAARPKKDDRNGVSICIPTAPGVIASSVDDCALMMKAWFHPRYARADLNLPHIPFDDAIYRGDDDGGGGAKRSLRVGYFRTDRWFEPCAAMKRAMDETIAGLERDGHTCVPFDIPTTGWDHYRILVKINAAEGDMRSYVEALDGEPMAKEFKELHQATTLPNALRPLVRAVVDARRSFLIGNSRSGGIAVSDLWEQCQDLLDMRRLWSDAYREARIDAILHPGYPLPAVPHGMTGKLTMAVSYMFLANLLLWPSGVVPVTTVKRRCDEERYRPEELPSDQRDVTSRIAHSTMKDSDGMPVGVSVMTPAYQDEMCLRVMKAVETAVDFRERPQKFKESGQKKKQGNLQS